MIYTGRFPDNFGDDNWKLIMCTLLALLYRASNLEFIIYHVIALFHSVRRYFRKGGFMKKITVNKHTTVKLFPNGFL